MKYAHSAHNASISTGKSNNKANIVCYLVTQLQGPIIFLCPPPPNPQPSVEPWKATELREISILPVIQAVKVMKTFTSV
jgi:hypothetical protein